MILSVIFGLINQFYADVPYDQGYVCAGRTRKAELSYRAFQIKVASYRYQLIIFPFV